MLSCRATTRAVPRGIWRRSCRAICHAPRAARLPPSTSRRSEEHASGLSGNEGCRLLEHHRRPVRHASVPTRTALLLQPARPVARHSRMFHVPAATGERLTNPERLGRRGTWWMERSCRFRRDGTSWVPTRRRCPMWRPRSTTAWSMGVRMYSTRARIRNPCLWTSSGSFRPRRAPCAGWRRRS